MPGAIATLEDFKVKAEKSLLSEGVLSSFSDAFHSAFGSFSDDDKKSLIAEIFREDKSVRGGLVQRSLFFRAVGRFYNQMPGVIDAMLGFCRTKGDHEYKEMVINNILREYYGVSSDKAGEARQGLRAAHKYGALAVRQALISNGVKMEKEVVRPEETIRSSGLMLAYEVH